MGKPILSDQNQFPTEEIVFSHIGKSKSWWGSLFEKIQKKHPDFTEQWRYYKDGNSWLMKVTRKTKTIFWLSILNGSFRTTFYFGDKAEPVIMAGDIAQRLKSQFANGKRYGKIRGITVTVDSESAVDDILALVEIKLKIK